MTRNKEAQGSVPAAILAFTKSSSALELSRPGWANRRGAAAVWFGPAAEHSQQPLRNMPASSHKILGLFMADNGGENTSKRLACE
jgi:hypothetical protein